MTSLFRVPISTGRRFIAGPVKVNNVAIVSHGINAIRFDLHMTVVMAGVFFQKDSVAWPCGTAN
jgi:hypothetical protein